MNVHINISRYIQCLILVISLSVYGSSNISDCNRCKTLADSFNYGLQKTARGKHEGGDAAWEEARLKSYSRSEMRLVEIQEGLCSDVKKNIDQCYTLAAEVEHLLEQWWIHNDPNSQDLFMWLCIDALKYCCPKNHFGLLCSPCPVDKNNKICGGRGKCDGDETRQGNGSCICNKGFSGDLCESCAKNYFNLTDENCHPCHKACNGCSGKGPEACEECNVGWESKAGVCTDINECMIETSCGVHQYCINREGSYSCKICDESCRTCKGYGKANCTSCSAEYLLWDGMCLDDTFKQQLRADALKRVLLYLFLFIITILIYLRIKSLGSLFTLLMGIFIYFLENNNKFNILSTYFILQS